VIAWFVVGLLSTTAQVAPSPSMEMRLVIGTDVACRAQPDRNSPVVEAHRLGEPLTVRGMTPDLSGAAWYEVVGLRTCWVSGPLTVAFAGYDSPDTALAAIAEHALALGANASFEHLVAVDNLLLERRLRRPRYFRAPAAMPPLLEMRHLQIVDRAARTIDGRWSVERDPLRNAWVLAHADVVTYFEPGGLFHVRGSHFGALYERHRASPEAEDIAWVAAESPVFTDECYTECHLSVLAQSHMPYWRQFPSGRHVLEAVASGVRRVARGARFCPLVAAEYLQESPAQIQELVGSLRESLQDVTAAGQDDLLRHLSEIEATCLGSALDLKSPQAIPELVKTLGLGFTFVPHQLAEFGEDAEPAVLAVVTSSESDREAVYTGLMALRFMIEGAGPRPLSPGARERIRQAAEQWLAARRQSILTLGAAIDLAAALDDPDLRRILQSLASDPNAVASRGISAGSIEGIRKRAADRLAGVPPLPRP
jgi:hypothetical protein